MSKNFRAIYCERRSLPPAGYEQKVLFSTLYWHAHGFRFLLGKDFFLPDLEFVRAIGELRSRRHFSDEATTFHYHPANRTFLRRILKVRVSASKMRRLVDEEMEIANSRPPMEMGGK